MSNIVTSYGSSILRGACVAAVVASLGGAAQAADLPSRAQPPAPVLVAETFHPFQVTLRATAVVPDNNSSVVDSYGRVLPLTGLSSGPGSNIFYSGVNVETAVWPTLGLHYYFTKNWAVEVICCMSKNKITGTGFLRGLNIGDKFVFPPTVSLQYHFTNFGAFQPYIGVGVNYTRVFGGTSGANWAPFMTPALGLTGFNGVTALDIKDSWGVSLQFGFDIMMNDRWGVNFDMKRILMEPNAYLRVYNTATGATIPLRSRVNIDPWLVSAGITYKFGGESPQPVVAKY